MTELRYGLQGKERKPLISAIADILNTEAEYLGVKSGYAYRVGDYEIDKFGTLAGEYNASLVAELAERGFVPEGGVPEAEQPAEAQENPSAANASEENAAPDTVTIEIPLAGFTPDSLDILCKMVEAKSTLIKMALEVNALPIKILDDRVAFPWFKTTDSAEINAYSQFITALATTAKEKKRVTAKSQDSYENPRFTMRVWLISLGLIGREFDLCRKLMMRGLPGNSGFRYGKPSGETLPRQRSNVQREVLSIRLTPDTLEKMNALAAKTEAETGQRTSRNMLIEQICEAYVAEMSTSLEDATAQTAGK